MARLTLDTHLPIIKKKERPYFIVKYEDAINDLEKTLTDIFTFVIGFDLKGTVIEKRIKDVVAEK